MTQRLHTTDRLDRATGDVLRSLDPAARADQRLVSAPRAQDTLTRILASDTAGTLVAPPARAGRTEGHSRRWVLAGAALVGAGALVVVPGLLGGETASAMWSAIPKAVPPAEATLAGEDCRMRNIDDPTRQGPGRKVVENADIVIVEGRGAWTYVLLGGDGGYEATCLLRDNGPGEEVTGGGYTGSLGVEKVGSNTVVTHGTRAQSDDNSSYREITGRVGSDVASVILNTRQQGPVTASVRGGYFAAWWPGPPIVGMEGPGPEPTVTLILKDGTTRADIPMAQIDMSRN